MLSALVHFVPPASPEGVAPGFGREVADLRPLVRAAVAAVLRERVDHPDVEDCTQEVLRRAVEGAASRSGALRPWLLGVARHVALDAIRARRRARGRAAGDGLEDAPASGVDLLVERLVDPSPLADQGLERDERAARLTRAIAALPEGPRRALELFHGEELGYQAIAARLDVPLGTVATWITRGRRAIAEVLAEEDPARRRAP